MVGVLELVQMMLERAVVLLDQRCGIAGVAQPPGVGLIQAQFINARLSSITVPSGSTNTGTVPQRPPTSPLVLPSGRSPPLHEKSRLEQGPAGPHGVRAATKAVEDWQHGIGVVLSGLSDAVSRLARASMVHHDPEVAVIVLAPGPGFVDLADLAVFILRIHPAHGGGGVAIQANHCILCPGFFPGAALPGVRVGLVADGKARIIEPPITTDEVGHSSTASRAEGAVAEGPGGFKGDRADLVVVGAIDHISGKGFGGIKAFVFVGLADRDQGIGPGLLRSINLSSADPIRGVKASVVDLAVALLRGIFDEGVRG